MPAHFLANELSPASGGGGRIRLLFASPYAEFSGSALGIGGLGMDFDWLWSGSASDRTAENARHFAWMASVHALEFARAAERRGLKDLSLVFEMAALEATEVERPRDREARTELRSQRQRHLPRWHVTRLAGSAARDVGFVHAIDASQAIRIAIERYEITDPEKRKRLAARRVA